MDNVGRKAFWDMLCSLKNYNQESRQQLREVAPIPHELCRFRTVNEQSLLQLQNNEMLFSTANYYDDPFDTYFSIDFPSLKSIYGIVRSMVAGGDTEWLLEMLHMIGLDNNVDAIIKSLGTTELDMNTLELSLIDIRKMIQRQINSICFCENPLNETTWLKYAGQHKGFVQVYDFNDQETKLCGNDAKCDKCGIAKYPPMICPVYYTDLVYDATSYALNLLVQTVFSKQLLKFPESVLELFCINAAWQNEKISLIKKKCHQYDLEWRMILPTQFTSRPMIKWRPKSIMIGLNTPEYQRRLIISAAHIAGINEIYQVIINDYDRLDKEKILKD